jgi:hypothetical protein
MAQSALTHEGRVQRIGEQALGATVVYTSKAAADELDSSYWYDRLTEVVYIDTKPQSMREWLVAHDGERVFTAQSRVDVMSQEVRQFWTPGARTVEAALSRTKFIEADERSFSIREYRGVRALRSSKDTWVGYDYSSHNLIAYTVVPS